MSKKQAEVAEPEAKLRKLRYVRADIAMRHSGCTREIEAIRRFIGSVTLAFERERRSYEEYLHKQMKDAPSHVAESLNERSKAHWHPRRQGIP